jgi:hypothetical protein
MSKGWIIEWHDGLSCYATAETASKARYKAFRGCDEAGFHADFRDFKVRRYPRLDGHDLRNRTVTYDGMEEEIRYGKIVPAATPSPDGMQRGEK